MECLGEGGGSMASGGLGESIRSNSRIVKNKGAANALLRQSDDSGAVTVDDVLNDASEATSTSGGTAASAAANQTVTNGTPGQGAQFIYVAATVANILCDNMTQIQINLLANFLSVVTTCVFAILTVESPMDVLGD